MRLIIKDNYDDCSLGCQLHCVQNTNLSPHSEKNRSFWACPPDQPRSAHTVN